MLRVSEWRHKPIDYPLQSPPIVRRPNKLTIPHASLDQDILDRRAALYETARQRHPQRWKGPTRNWTRIHTVHLNPDRDDDHDVIPQPRNQGRKAA